MAKYNDYTFVVWGNGFEELAATTFVTRLRKAGLRVKVVGLPPQQRINGACGLALVPDMMLDKALSLVDKAVCLIIPCTPLGIKRFSKDPRWNTFLAQICANRAKVVIGKGQPNNHSLESVGFPSDDVDALFVHMDGESLLNCARELADLLSPVKI